MFILNILFNLAEHANRIGHCSGMTTALHHHHQCVNVNTQFL